MSGAVYTNIDLRVRLACLREELRREACQMDVHSLERLCRRINVLEIKMHSFKGGLYGKEQ